MISRIDSPKKSFKVNKMSIKKTPKVQPLQLKSLQVIPDYPDDYNDYEVENNQISLSARYKDYSNLQLKSNMCSIELDRNLSLRYQKNGQNLHNAELSTKNTDVSRINLNSHVQLYSKSKKSRNQSICSISKSRKRIDCSPGSRNILDTTIQSKLDQSREISKDIKLQIQKMMSINESLKNSKKDRKKYLMRRFKLWSWIVVYINRIKRFSFRSALKRKCNMQNLIIKINKPIQDLIQYYNQLLRNPLELYIKMIKQYTRDPQFCYEQYAFQLIQQISIRLQNSKITKTLVQIFKVTATERSFIPSKYLFQFQIQRLDFSQNYACLINVTPEQTQMIIGIFLGIQIICGNILYKPWIGIQKNGLDERQYPLYRNIVKDVGSIIYFLLKSHYEQIPLNYKNKSYLLEDLFGIEPQGKISIVPPKFKDKYQVHIDQHHTKLEFFQNQDKGFLEELNSEYKDRMMEVKQRLISWIKRISTKVLLYTMDKS